MNVTIDNATLINGKKTCIQIENGCIKEIGPNINKVGKVLRIPDGVYVSAGWIDIHTHSFPKYEPYCAYPDDIGWKTGVTTVVDAGSCGSDDMEEFYGIAKQCKTNVLAFLNISSCGLKIQNELADVSRISAEKISQIVEKYPEFIVGLKARMSASIVGGNDIIPLQLAKSIGKKLNVPIMVHIGNAPPKLINIIQLLEKGDIITHCFNKKDGNHIFSNEMNVPILRKAIRHGVYLDVGHGTSSFSYDIAKQAKEENVPFHSISTDIYDKNRKTGPVFNMATTMMKFIALGYSLERVIHAVTSVPATMINQPHIGRLEKGMTADLTFFQLEQKETKLTDSLGDEIISPIIIKPYAVLIGGEYNVC